MSWAIILYLQLQHPPNFAHKLNPHSMCWINMKLFIYFMQLFVCLAKKVWLHLITNYFSFIKKKKTSETHLVLCWGDFQISVKLLKDWIYKRTTIFCKTSKPNVMCCIFIFRVIQQILRTPRKHVMKNLGLWFCYERFLKHRNTCKNGLLVLLADLMFCEYAMNN